MSTTIRMSRAGTKKRPYYRIVVTNSRSPRDSKFIERIGTYNPMLPSDDAKRVTIDTERAKHWLASGVQLSDRVHVFFNKAGLVNTKPKFKPAKGSKKEQKSGPAAAEAPAAA